MADKTIGELPAASEVYDDSLLVMEQQGEARSVQGALIKKYAREATAAYVEEAKGHADDAKGQAEAARASADAAAESARDAADIALHPPILKEENDHWWIWDTGLNDYKDSGIDAGVSLDVVEEVIAGEPGSGASVKNLGTKTDPRLQFTIPQGEKGDKGDAATIEVGEVTTGEPGEAASVKNSGTPGAAKLDFIIPKGDTGRGFTILGYYDTAGALEAAVQDPSVGDAYGVGTEKPYDIYIYDADKGWVDNGPIGGVPELPQHLVVAGGDEVPTEAATLRDNDTGKPVAPRTTIKALSGEGSEGDYVGFTAGNQVGVIKKGAWPCNINILDNWYLIGGGSQKGNGDFPINQKGKTAYTNPTRTSSLFGIDRWEANGDDTITLLDDCIRIESSGNLTSHQWFQRLEKTRLVHGQKYIFSILYRGRDEVVRLFSLPFVFNSDAVHTSAAVPGTNRVAVVDFRTGMTNGTVGFREDDHSGAASAIDVFIELFALKLEAGSVQTLAHQEGDTWALNEIPNYQQELAKCQRYFYATSGTMSTTLGAYRITNTAGATEYEQYIQFFIAAPVILRSRPTVIFESSAPSGACSAWLVPFNVEDPDAHNLVVNLTHSSNSIRDYEGPFFNSGAIATLVTAGDKAKYFYPGAAGLVVTSGNFRILLDSNLGV